ncbi:MAG: polymer-forming cytoskeletal protein [Chloroflexi bacterium]|nr:polymer-forming cytoskeletal protein [Chloroflexota bacterium]
MKRLTWKQALLILVLIGLLAPFAVAQAQGPAPGDKVIFAGGFVLRSGETIDGDLAVFGGSVRTEANSIVDGDVAIFGGTGEIDGRVNGDIAVFGGIVNIGPNAVVRGDIVSLGGKVYRDPNAEVRGDVFDGLQIGHAPAPNIQIPGLPPVTPNNISQPESGEGPKELLGIITAYLLRTARAVMLTAILAALGVLLIALFPEPTQRVGRTAGDNAFLSLGAGCLTIVLGVPTLIVLAITICLLPLAAVFGAMLAVASIFGWLALGWWLGKRLLTTLNAKNPTLITETVVGVAALTLVWQLPSAIPFVGGLVSWFIGLVVGSIGLGAVLLTRFGARDYNHRQSGPRSPISPPSSQPELETPPTTPPALEAEDPPLITPPPKENDEGEATA